MARAAGSDLHVDVPLSNLTIGYKNSKYIADDIFPVVPSENQSDMYYIWDKDPWFRNYVQRRAPGTEYPEGGLTVSTDDFYCPIYHLAYPINDEDIENADEVLDYEANGSEWLADQFKLNREIYMVENFFKTGVWGNETTGVAGAPGTNQFRKWSDFSNSDPEADLRAAKQAIEKATGMEPNMFVVGPETRDLLQEHPGLIDLYKFSQVGILNDEQVTRALKVPAMKVGRAIRNTAAEGEAFSGSYLWGNNALLMYVAESPGKKKASAGYTFMWNIGMGTGVEVRIDNVRDELRDRKLLKGKHSFTHKVTGTDLSAFFSAVI